MASDGLPHHGVLSHEYDCNASKRQTNLLHLLRPDIVSAYDETLRVLFKECDQLGEVVALLGCFVFLTHLDVK